METSGLSFITNVPENPMQIFANWHNEANEHSDPNLFLDTMTIAGLSDTDDLLNRNVILRKHDDNGLIFVTERNTMKFKDFVKNPSVAAVFLWIYMINGTAVTRQVRVLGKVAELSELEIAEFYKEEPLFARIRSKICRCGEPVDWNDLKAKHDLTLKDYQDGKDTLPQRDTYTAMRIIPQKFDFYHARRHEIADRVKYTLEDGKWINYHIAT
ncbi:pyridoxine/pyridoxamine 5'-phosphate oxidase 2 isoform X2 [Sitodiplosis mosellana]|nr:pyridoxine/pyridoxamine 5'-phosphate oxidase 2 isoform X2 [Sitodiplosis mosellana]XP_055298079.1 pyridoxine/pyridoxamine 5'-phosphate oxidase 2 isoform X2 [Sitodiplosis mosellana]XP_055298080.1 pyridoxine/pyridoxamine 5'-phosphate oxidase 2 isoform X2 [Sitodiplosis mosellana]XP_055298081.1 pyridoxine/pyridoxamine 5'-phosphate oxidase 2 isoform X2 [Sitodiplosis mosellana]XP_055298082.1 pyridoxine/pyridoxamine 5'-phosphate oxidase 2 isoform X2 [Sitodiplosis mosellana]